MLFQTANKGAAIFAFSDAIGICVKPRTTINQGLFFSVCFTRFEKKGAANKGTYRHWALERAFARSFARTNALSPKNVPKPGRAASARIENRQKGFRWCDAGEPSDNGKVARWGVHNRPSGNPHLVLRSGLTWLFQFQVCAHTLTNQKHALFGHSSISIPLFALPHKQNFSDSAFRA